MAPYSDQMLAEKVEPLSRVLEATNHNARMHLYRIRKTKNVIFSEKR